MRSCSFGLRLVSLVVMVAVSAAACASDGRELAEPLPNQTTTTRPPPPTSAPNYEDSPSGLTLSSPDFDPGDPAPIDTTCAGENKFPNLQWAGVASTAAEIVVTLSDQTDPEEPLLLWLLAGISPNVRGLDAGVAPPGAFETLNDYGNLGYGSPCLDTLENGPRDLQFRVHILDQPSGLAGGDPGNEAWESVRAQATDSATVLMRVDSAP